MNNYKTRLLEAITLLDDTAGEVSEQKTEQEQNKIIESVALLTDYINNTL